MKKGYGVVIRVALMLLAMELSGKTTVATINGDWSGAVWNNGAPVSGDLVVINSGVNISLAEASPLLTAITNNGILTFKGWDSSLSAEEVVVNGTITHPQQSAVATNELGEWVANNRIWIICSNLTVNAGKLIDANGKGFTIGPGNNIEGTRGRDGAGHGGKGGTGLQKGGPIYGNTNAPVTPGSGGGAQSAATGGQPGGGVVRIEATGMVRVDGTIQADGLPQTKGSGDKGGGSGGSVWINCRALSGNGQIRVRGGNAGSDVANSGGGGGGRIAIYYAANDNFVGNVIAQGGYRSIVDNTSVYSGQPGTIVRHYTGTIPLLTVVSAPPTIGVPAPYGFGDTAVSTNAAIANSVSSPVDGGVGERYVLLGWSASTNGVSFAAGDGLMASFMMPATNAVLEYVWTNQFYLEVGATTGGIASGSPTGWYTNGAVVEIGQSADSGYYFSQWLGEVPGAKVRDTVLGVTMDRPRSLQAAFGTSVPADKRWTGTGEWSAAGNWSPSGVPAANDNVTIAEGTVTLPYAAWIADLVVSNGAKVVLRNWDTAINAERVEIFGTLTHEACVAQLWEPEVSNRVNVVCQEFFLHSNGVINADSKGYAPMGPGGSPISARHGGSHGGKGGDGYNASGDIYGSVNEPLAPGSSGGAQTDGRGGGKGGGAVRLQVSERAVLDGIITADGKVGAADSGGGSGGSVWISCKTVSGNGTIRANGGPAQNSNSGGGGGGRVALHYDTAAQAAVVPKPQIKFSVACGSPTFAKTGGLGSIHVSDTQVLPAFMPVEFNGIIHNIGEWSFEALVCSGMVEFAESQMRLSSSGDIVFGLPAGYTYRPSLSATAVDCGGTFVLARYGMSLVNEPVLKAKGLAMADAASITVNSAATNGAAPGYGALVDVRGAGRIGNGCWIYPVSDQANGGSPFFHFNSLVIETNGGFNGSLRGFGANYNAAGYGPGAGLKNNAGGGYGGLGGRASVANGGMTNGLAARPGHPGSAGHSANNSTSGRGGGYVRLDVSRRLVFAGAISVNGGSAPAYCGAAAGGGIFITCGAFIGAAGATLKANGGKSSNESYYTFGGGGGRIAVWRVSDVNGQGVVATEVYGGVVTNPNGASGTDGTVYWGWSPSDGTILLVR